MNNTIFLISLTAICCLGGFASDINAPSIESIANSLNTSIDTIQFTMTIYFIGFSLSQLFYGPLTDTVGRIKPLATGILLFTFSSILSAISTDATFLILTRLGQGLGAGATACIWRAMFLDRFNKDEIVIYASYLQLFILFTLPSAPLIGGLLDKYISWQSTFVFMGTYGVICFAITQFMQEDTLKEPLPFNITSVSKRYKDIVTHPVFIRYILCAATSYGIFVSWFFVGKVLTKLDTDTFGLYCFITSVPAIFIASRINKQFIATLGADRLIIIGFSLMMLGAIIIGISQLLSIMPLLFLAYFLIVIGAMIVPANTFSKAFEPFGNTAGTAAGIYGGLQQLGASVTGTIITFLPEETAYPYATLIIILSLILLLSFRAMSHFTVSAKTDQV